MKKIILSLLLLITVVPVWAEVECPYGTENDPYPGDCALYTDENADNYCDYSQEELGAHLEDGEDHECTEVVETHEGEISGEELKSMTVAQVATLYGTTIREVISILSTEVMDVEVTAETLLRTLHDEHNLRMATVKDLFSHLNPELNSHDDTNTTDSMIWEYIQQFYFHWLIIVVAFTIAMYLIHFKYKKLHKGINIGFLYILVPLASIFWPIYLGYVQNTGHEVFSFGRWIGYAATWLLALILFVKPLFILGKPDTKLHRYFAYVISQRRELGIAIFYMILGHGLVYFIFRLTKDIPFFSFFVQLTFAMALTGFISLLIGWLTSNNLSIKKLGKRRKPMQMFAYLAFIAGVVHIFLINKTTGIFWFAIVFIYIILKIAERRKVHPTK